jgi:Na+-driven multidrug efflux pump
MEIPASQRRRGYRDMKSETIMLTITLALAIALVTGLVVLPAAAEAIQLLQDADNNTLEQVHHKSKHDKEGKHNV